MANTSIIFAHAYQNKNTIPSFNHAVHFIEQTPHHSCTCEYLKTKTTSAKFLSKRLAKEDAAAKMVSLHSLSVTPSTKPPGYESFITSLPVGIYFKIQYSITPSALVECNMEYLDQFSTGFGHSHATARHAAYLALQQLI